MRNIKKILLRILTVLIIILSVIAYFSISFIDTTPYFETEYYRNSIAKIDSAKKELVVEKGLLKAGFATINITPTIVSKKQNPSEGKFTDIKLAGFGGGKKATYVHDSIYAKAVALDVNNKTIVLLSADLLMIPESVVLKVEKKLKGYGIGRKQIIFGATHTHSSIGNCVPGIIGKQFAGDYQDEVAEWLSSKFYKVIVDAIADKKEAKIGSEFINSPGLVKNRIIGKSGRLNDKFTVVSIKQNEGKHAVIGIFAAHATTIGTWNDGFSADYPGEFQNQLESKGIDMAMFFAGTTGSHSNIGEGDKFEKVKFLGSKLTEKALSVIDSIKYTDNSSLSSITISIEIPKLQLLYISDGLRLSPEVGNLLVPKMKSIYLQGFKLNNIVWIAMPYELSGEYGIDLKNALEINGYNSVLSSFNGQYLGYIVPMRYYYYDNYEPRLMGWYGPSMGDYLMELNYKIANELTGCKL
jgi:hypothetical protein